MKTVFSSRVGMAYQSDDSRIGCGFHEGFSSVTSTLLYDTDKLIDERHSGLRLRRVSDLVLRGPVVEGSRDCTICLDISPPGSVRWIVVGHGRVPKRVSVHFLAEVMHMPLRGGVCFFLQASRRPVMTYCDQAFLMALYNNFNIL